MQEFLIHNPLFSNTAMVILLGMTFFAEILLALSYTIAFRVKPTIMVFSFFVYFWTSAIIYFLLFAQVTSFVIAGKCLFEHDYTAVFFVTIAIMRIITAIFSLYSTWKIKQEIVKLVDIPVDITAKTVINKVKKKK